MSIDILLVHKVIVVLIDAICIWLGLWVYFSDRKSKINQNFSLMTFFLFLWVTCGYLSGVVYAGNPSLSLLFAKINMAVVCLFFTPFYFFSVYFPSEGKKHPWFDIFILFFWFTLAFFSIGSNLVVAGVKDGQIVYGDILGSLFLLSALAAAVLAIVLMFKKYFKLTEKGKTKAQYLITGILFWFFLNIIFNVLSPLLFHTMEYYAFGDYSAIFILGFSAYAIMKRELFGIKALLTEGLVFIMGTVLFIIPFLIRELWIKIILFAIFFFFCVIGYFLVKYTRRAEREKMMLSEQVGAKTKDLNVAQKKIQEHKEELDKFYKLTVGRELRMAELKKEIKKRDEKLENK